MKYYVYLENNQVVIGPKMLPLSWNNISNFNALDDDSLRFYGWYPHKFVHVQLEPDETLIGSEFIIESNEVVEYQRKRKKTESEIQSDKQAMWEAVISRRNIELKESDWTQLPDIPFTEEKKQQWIQYRQLLRDITKYDDPYNIPWPGKPE